MSLFSGKGKEDEPQGAGAAGARPPLRTRRPPRAGAANAINPHRR